MALQYPAAGDHRLDDTTLTGGMAFNTALSMCYWVKVQALTVRQSIFGIYSTGGVSAVQLGTDPGVYSAWKWGGTILCNSTTTTFGVLHHVGYSFDGTTHRLYMNGVEEANSIVAPQTGTMQVIQFNGYIGAGALETSPSLVDDARVYTRTLTANEFQTIHACRGTDGIVSGLIARYHYDERAPGTAVATGDIRDASGNQQGPMTLTGSGFTYAESTLRFRRRVL